MLCFALASATIGVDEPRAKHPHPRAGTPSPRWYLESVRVRTKVRGSSCPRPFFEAAPPQPHQELTTEGVKGGVPLDARPRKRMLRAEGGRQSVRHGR